MTALLALLFLLAAPASFAESAGTAKSGPRKTAESGGQTDEQLEKAIRARLARSKIAENGFQVRVQGGVATLTGRTAVVQHKGTATRLAKSAGAARVVNQIEITAEARKKAAASLASGRRRQPAARGEPRSEPPREAPPRARVRW